MAKPLSYMLVRFFESSLAKFDWTCKAGENEFRDIGDRVSEGRQYRSVNIIAVTAAPTLPALAGYGASSSRTNQASPLQKTNNTNDETWLQEDNPALAADKRWTSRPICRHVCHIYVALHRVRTVVIPIPHHISDRDNCFGCNIITPDAN